MGKVRYEINGSLEKYRKFILQIKDFFPLNGETIYKKRNEIKIIYHEGNKLCVKSFGNNNPINRLVYSGLRPSKAKRSYLYAKRLLSKNIKTPEPVAYVEYYNKIGILQNSYYISLYFEHDFALKQVFGFDLQQRAQILPHFAHYIYHYLHKNGVIHKDLSPGNVLIKQQENNKYEFALIDLNRVSFKKSVNLKMGISNLKRFDGNVIDLSTIGFHYALNRGVNPDDTALKLCVKRFLFLFFRKKRKRVKKLVKNIFSWF